jgi:hypothetical protein
MAREYEFNVDFDLSLRRSPPETMMGELNRQISEMAWHALFAGRAGDSVRVSGPVPGEFLDGLERNGLTVPELTIRPAIRSDRRFTPFGWSQSAIELNGRYREPSPHPGWSVVRRVNGRSFARALEIELTGYETPAVEARSVEEIVACLAAQPDSENGWIVKADHGNSGLGNRRLRDRELGDRDREWIGRLLEEDDLLLLEQWRRRVLDIGVSFDLGADGKVADLVNHEVVNTADGAFIGAIYGSGSPTIEPWRRDLESPVERVAERLHQEGYFGPVNLDAFVWEREGEDRLRPLVDLNARSNMSSSVKQLWDSWERPGVLYWRFFTRRRLHLPETHHELEEAIGMDRFDPDRRRGVLVTSPMWVIDGGRRSPLHKLGVLFVADTRNGVLAQERRFRERFDR